MFMVQILFSVANMEAQLTKSRMVSGYRNHIKNGGKVGRKSGSIETEEEIIQKHSDVLKLLKKIFREKVINIVLISIQIDGRIDNLFEKYYPRDKRLSEKEIKKEKEEYLKNQKRFHSPYGDYFTLLNVYNDLIINPYVFNLNDTNSSNRFELILCPFNKSVSVKELNESNNILISQDENGAFVKTFFDQNTKTVISVYNILGQKMTKDIILNEASAITRLEINNHNQILFVKVVANNQSLTKKIVTH
jgi:hypothetical protein